MADEKKWGDCPCGGELVPKDEHWAMCTKCGDDSFPISMEAAYGPDGPPNIACGTFKGVKYDQVIIDEAKGTNVDPEQLDLEDNAAVDALNAIAEMCGVPEWDYPGQVVRDVRYLKETAVSVETRNQRLMLAIEQAKGCLMEEPRTAHKLLESAMFNNLPYPPDRGRTHYDGCWQNRGHHNCAVRQIQELSKQINEGQRDIQKLREKYGVKPGESLMKAMGFEPIEKDPS